MSSFDAEGLDVGSDRSETRSPLSASGEISACSAAGPSPASLSVIANALGVGGTLFVVDHPPRVPPGHPYRPLWVPTQRPAVTK